MKGIKDSIAAFLYRVLVLIVKLLPARGGTNHLLIIKLDEIGDYMLFRNQLKYFKQSGKYKNHKITLLGNIAWKAIFDEYDTNAVDDTIWITKKKFNRNLFYRFSLLKQIRHLKTSDVVNCIFSRSMILDDGFAFVAKAVNKIAMKGDNSNKGRYAINLDRLVYTDLIDAGDKRLFESIRNSSFLGKLLSAKLPVGIGLSVIDRQSYSFHNYFVIFIGPGNKMERRWPLSHFLACAEYVYAHYKYIPVICGGPPDEPTANSFMQLYKGEAINLAGKTTLPGFIELVSKAKFLLSVDNGPVHLAAAARCPVIGLYSGVHYGRYAPYPEEVAHPFYAVYCDYVDELVSQKNDIVYDPFVMKNEFIGTIDVKKVTPYIDKMIKTLSINRTATF